MKQMFNVEPTKCLATMDLSISFQIKACNVCKPFERCGVNWWYHVSRVHYSVWLTELGLSCGTVSWACRIRQAVTERLRVKKGETCLYRKQVFRANHTHKKKKHSDTQLNILLCPTFVLYGRKDVITWPSWVWWSSNHNIFLVLFALGQTVTTELEAYNCIQLLFCIRIPNNWS